MKKKKVGLYIFEFDWEEEGVGANSRLGAYSNKYGISLVFIVNVNNRKNESAF